MIGFDAWSGLLERLPSDAAIRTHRCWTCSRCRETFGLTGLLEGTPLDPIYGGWHYDILWEGKERVFGGRVSRVIGLTDEAAFQAVARLLP